MRDIGWAVKQMRNGLSVRRRGWNGNRMYIRLVQDINPPGGLPYVAMWMAQGEWQPGWVCSQADLLGTDWEIAY